MGTLTHDQQRKDYKVEEQHLYRWCYYGTRMIAEEVHDVSKAVVRARAEFCAQSVDRMSVGWR